MPLYPPTTTPLTPTTPVTSSIVSPLPTPTYGDTFGTFTVLTKTLILHPKSQSNPKTPVEPTSPLTILLNTATWPLWNTFVPKCTFLPGSPHPGPIMHMGAKVEFDVFMDGNGLVEGKTRSNVSPEEVTVVDSYEGGFVDAQGRKGGRVAWKSVQFPTWLMKAERVLEVVDVEGGWEFTSFETFGGPFATVIRWTVASTLVDRLGDYGRDLKAFVEKGGEE